MRRFFCDVCGAEISFTAAQCDSCATELGFFPSDRDVLPLSPASGGGYTTSDPTSTIVWRCLNFAWGCNWMLAADSGDVWCEACRLTRGRPDESSIDAVLAWSTTEQAKRRLVFQLRTLQLPIGDPSADPNDDVVFDLVYLPDSQGVTGHRAGVVTLDLREVDDRYRESARRMFRESDRTVLGHLRHEIGHHYWRLLVSQCGATEEFRSLFGDERVDYQAALEAHYATLGRELPDTHLSSYATAHPSEDWAETFAHYLHLRDGLETADAFGLGSPDRPFESFAAMVRSWRVLTSAVNEISLGLGHVEAYPFAVGPVIEAKLDFVHRQVLRFTAGGPSEPRPVP